MSKFKIFIIGSLIISLSVFCLFLLTKKYIHQYYSSQLEKIIVDKYMDGENSIGSISFNNYNKKISVNTPGLYTKDVELLFTDSKYKMSPFEMNTFNWNNEVIFDNTPLLNELSNGSNYKLWSGLDNCLKCLVIKKTKRGFDIIEEKIFGIGFNYDISNNPLFVQKEFSRFPKIKTDSKNYDIDSDEYNYTEHTYLINFDLCKNYINYLSNEKYSNTKFQQTYNNLMELRMKSSAPTPEDMYFNNEFYVLRPDPFYENCSQSINKYGNDFNTLYGITTTIKYTILPKNKKLDYLLENTYIVVLISLISIWAIYSLRKK